MYQRRISEVCLATVLFAVFRIQNIPITMRMRIRFRIINFSRKCRKFTFFLQNATAGSSTFQSQKRKNLFFFSHRRLWKFTFKFIGTHKVVDFLNICLMALVTVRVLKADLDPQHTYFVSAKKRNHPDFVMVIKTCLIVNTIKPVWLSWPLNLSDCHGHLTCLIVMGMAIKPVWLSWPWNLSDCMAIKPVWFS